MHLWRPPLMGTKYDFLFRVMKGRNQDKNKLLIWFQGGGGCFSPLTCSRPFRKMVEVFAQEKLFETNAAHNGHEGIFDRNHPENPFRDWTSVEIPLCTADSHVGHAVYGTAHHNGANNAEVVFHYIFQNMPNPDRIVIAGCSAGSMGAQAWSGRLIQTFRDMGCKAPISVIGDSYVGNVPRESAGKIIQYWGVCDAYLYWSPELKAKCDQGDTYFPELISYTIKKFPDVAFSFLATKEDIVEKSIYCVMKHSFNPGKLDCIDAKTFHRGVEKILVQYVQASKNNVAIYILEGLDHCLVQRHIFYSANIGAKRNGTGWLYLKHWVALLAGDLNEKVVPSGCEDPRTPDGVECNHLLENAQIDFTVLPVAEAPVEVPVEVPGTVDTRFVNSPSNDSFGPLELGPIKRLSRPDSAASMLSVTFSITSIVVLTFASMYYN